MKLTVFSAETFPIERDPAEGISMNAKITFGKNGKIFISKPACELLGIAKKDKISFAQDDVDTENWYVFIDEAGYELQEGKRGSLFLEHPELVKQYIGAWELDPAISHQIALVTEPRLIRKKFHFRLHLLTITEQAPEITEN